MSRDKGGDIRVGGRGGREMGGGQVGRCLIKVFFIESPYLVS